MKLKLTVDGKLYEVDVEVAEPEQPHPSYVPPAGQARRETSSGPAPPVRSTGEKVADESKVCRSPISGVVVKAPVQVGQQIQVNDILLVLEAMKMETEVTAPITGTVKAIHVVKGEPANPNEVLIEIVAE